MTAAIIAGAALSLMDTSTAAAKQMVVPLQAFQCGSWLQARAGTDTQSQVDATQASHWIHGYISRAALNYTGDILGGFADGTSLSAYVDKFCRDRPLNNIADAAEALESELAARVATAAPATKHPAKPRR